MIEGYAGRSVLMTVSAGRAICCVRISKKK